MKNIYFFFIIFLSVTTLNAQLSLTKAFNSPVSGNSYTINYYDSTSVVSKATGTNKLWNYSSVITSTTPSAHTTFTTVSSIPGASAAFPTANLAYFTPPATATTDYSMMKSNPTSDETIGSFTGTTATTYSNTQIDMTYPFTYGSSFSDISGYSSGTGTNTSTQGSTVTVTGTGTGTLVLPGNITLTNCLQVKYSGIITATAAGFPFSATITAYQYYHSSQKFAVATLNYARIDFFSQITNDFIFGINNAVIPVSSIKENSNNFSFNLFPNPASEKITIATDINSPKQMEVSIIDITGKQVSSETIDTDLKNDIDVSYLEKGIYFLTLNANGISSRKKFIKE